MIDFVLKEEVKMTIDPWVLFWKCFSIGDYVVCITDEDKSYIGFLNDVDVDGCILKYPRRKDRRLEWDQIRFMSNVGFPVKKLKGEESILKEKSLSEQLGQAKEETKQIKASISSERYAAWDRGYEAGKPTRVSGMKFGDPFLIENVDMIMCNQGGDEEEEALLLTAKDGAIGLLYDFNTVFEGCFNVRY